MKASELKVGDRIENYRVNRIYVITAVEPFSGQQNGEVAFNVMGRLGGLQIREIVIRRRRMTFKQFARLKFIRREGDRTS